MSDVPEINEILNKFKEKFNRLAKDIFMDPELKKIPPTMKIHSIKMMMENFLLNVLKNNFKDPIECANQYYQHNNTWKENQGNIIKSFIDKIEDKKFKKKFEEKLLRLIEFSLIEEIINSSDTPDVYKTIFKATEAVILDDKSPFGLREVKLTK